MRSWGTWIDGNERSIYIGYISILIFYVNIWLYYPSICTYIWLYLRRVMRSLGGYSELVLKVFYRYSDASEIHPDQVLNALRIQIEDDFEDLRWFWDTSRALSESSQYLFRSNYMSINIGQMNLGYKSEEKRIYIKRH